MDIDVIDEMDIDEDLNFRDESSNVSSFNNGNFRTKMAAGSFYIPQSSKAPLGEDAHFICIEEETIGVADGVGGWAKKGVDSGEYSRQLVKNAELSIHKQKDQWYKIDPMKVLNEAYFNTKCKGSSTACILTLTCDIVHAVNVGDSGFVVIRDGVIVYKSEIQQKRFNYPFQLGNGVKLDDPNVAQEIKVTVRTGDVIVMATDGLFDNVHGSELEILVRDGLVDLSELGTFPKMLAQKIAEYALQNSKSTWINTPFAEESNKARKHHRGGKRDDITVIVAHILPR
ncbi:probable protein phosphatase 2C 55 [Solanum dulcamara]|uniref:probable protein phosphatase 2C 55 n=1 Tax=Solanum dulcamara TaxID=45834 RepID=UPI002486ACE3|nr:probable protein phosphatase 2C 55 [Solanum dulcamara]